MRAKHLKENTMEDLDAEFSQLCGPADERVIRLLEVGIESLLNPALDPAYLAFVREHHGAVPRKSYFTASDGKTYRVGRFLTLVDGKSVLEPPFQESWEFPDRDVRIDWSAFTLVDQECATSRALFYGYALVPFAALYWHTEHPDGMSLTDGNVNLVGFLFNEDGSSSVVVWLAGNAAGEYSRWEDAREDIDEARYADFTVPVAPDFASFLALLRLES